MKAMELRNLKSGDYVQSVKTGEVLEVVGMEAGKYMLSNGKVYTESTIKRWWNIAVVEPQVEDNTEEQDTDTTANTSDLQDNTAQDNEIHENTEQTGQQDVVEGNTADKLTKEDIIYIIEHSNCDAVVKKEYIGAYKEGYKGAVCMVRTTKKGNAHIDIKQGIFNSLAESIRNRLEANYNAKVYDSTRGYIRLFEVDDLAVLQDLILAALKIA